MTVLSLFDGISIAQKALSNLGIPVKEYFASEIDKYCIQITNKNFPNTTQIGDVKEVHFSEGNSLIGKIDLLIGGSPCQDLSIAKKDRKGLDGERSGLFWEYLRILKETKPKYFILENVNSMPKEEKEKITNALWGIEPVMIDATLVSAQTRKRLFWVGKRSKAGYLKVEIPQPKDRGIFLKDILENGEADRLKSYCIDANYSKGANWKQYKTKGRRQLIRIGSLNTGGQGDRIYSPEGKSVNLSANGGGARSEDRVISNTNKK